MNDGEKTKEKQTTIGEEKGREENTRTASIQCICSFSFWHVAIAVCRIIVYDFINDIETTATSAISTITIINIWQWQIDRYNKYYLAKKSKTTPCSSILCSWHFAVFFSLPFPSSCAFECKHCFAWNKNTWILPWERKKETINISNDFLLFDANGSSMESVEPLLNL